MPRNYDNGKKKKKEKKRQRKLLLQQKLGLEPKKKYCHFKKEGISEIDYKDTALLKRFITDKGAIVPARNTGTSKHMQIKLTAAIKRARFMALIPYCPQKYL